MKTAKTGAISGCIVWALVFGVVSSCLVPAAMFVGGFTSVTNLAINTTGRFLCPEGTTPKSYSYSTTTFDEFGYSEPAAAYELHCVNADGVVVKEDPIVYAFLWDGLVILMAIGIGALLAFLLAAPAGILIARLFKRRDPSSMNIEPR